MTLYKKVMLLILLLILPLNLMAISVTKKAMDTTVEQMTMVDQQLAATTMRDLSGRVSNAISLLYYFATDDENCIQMMRQVDESAYVTAKLHFFVSLRNLAYMTNGADGYFFYLQNKGDMLFYSTESGVNSLNSDILLPQLKELPSGRWSLCEIQDTTYFLYMKNQKNTCYGAWINLDLIREELVYDIGYDTTQAVFVQPEAPELEKDRVGASETQCGLTLTISQQRKAVLRNISPESRRLYVLALVYLMAIPLIGSFINHFLLRPLKAVTRANQEIQNGNLDYRITEKAQSPEYKEVFRSFNAMAQDLKTTKFECYQKEAEKQTLELRNLQLQIRPHFLLNIFNLIYTLAQRNASEQIEDTILYLSSYFRYIFRSNSETDTFKKELDIIDGYLLVANFRYQNLISTEIDVTQDVKKVRIPPLLIHNFIENVVKHGLRQGKALHILIVGRFEEGVVSFRIRDDGIGMDEATLLHNRAVFRGELDMENNNEHIGLYYSYRRLKSYFGEEATIEVESEQNVGTCFTIRFPYESGGEDEATDCER